MISLSLCMIVKNEEAVLERILKPVSQVMDAILIAVLIWWSETGGRIWNVPEPAKAHL